MMTLANLPEFLVQPLRWAGIIGVGLLCGLLVGILAPLLVSLCTPKRLPVWGVRLIQLGAAVGGGYVASLYLLGSGGSGGPGGDGFLPGGKGGSGTKDKKYEKKPDEDVKPPKKDGDKGPITLDSVEAVHLLGKADRKERTGKENPDIQFCYWIESDPRERLRDFDGLTEELAKRKKKDPKLKVYMEGNDDSFDEDNQFVKRLERWLRDEKLYITKPEKKAR